MADDKLRMIAELVNKVSDPLRMMQRDINNFAKTGQDLNKIFNKFGKEVGFNTEATRKHTRETTRMRREMEAFRDVIRKVTPQFGELTNSMGEMTTGSGAIIGAIAGIGVALFETTKRAGEFADKMKNLRFASRETGLSPTMLRNMQQAARAYGMTADQMTNSLNNFVNVMAHVRQHDSPFIHRLLEKGAGRYTMEIIKLGLAGATTADQLDAVSRAIDRMKKEHPGKVGEQMSRDLLQLLGLDPAFNRMSLEQRKKLVAELDKLGADPYQMKAAADAAQRFDDELIKIDAIFEGWRTKLAPIIMDPLTHIMESFQEFVTSPEVGKFIQKKGEIAKIFKGWEPDLASDLQDIRAILDLLNRIYELSGQGLQKKMLEEWNKSPDPGKYEAQRLYHGAPPGRLGSKGPGGGWIPRYAEGGIVTQPTTALVGEKGPEAIIPLTGGGFDPFTKMQLLLEALFDTDSRYRSIALASGGGGGGITSYNEWVARRGGAGRGPLFRPGVGPRARGGGGMGRQAFGTENDNPSASLAESRQRMKAEIDKDPKLRDFVIDAAQHEGGIQSNLEQIMNYASMRHMTLRQALLSGQYGPVNTGRVTGAISDSTRNVGTKALDRVFGGSNITDYATDQGMAGDPNFNKYMSNRAYWNMHQVEGAWFSHHGEQGRAWAAQQRENDRRAIAEQEKATKVEGTGNLNVTVNAPPSTKVDASGGGIFKQTTIQRNIQMMPTAAGPMEQTIQPYMYGNN